MSASPGAICSRWSNLAYSRVKKPPARLLQPDEGQPDENTPHSIQARRVTPYVCRLDMLQFFWYFYFAPALTILAGVFRLSRRE